MSLSWNVDTKVHSDFFDKVKDLEDWRAPIDAEVDDADVEGVVRAIIFYTGCDPFTEQLGNGKTRVACEGYRNGPCGP